MKQIDLPIETPTQIKAERDELRVKLDNVHRCLRAATVALRDAGLDPYQGRQGEFA